MKEIISKRQGIILIISFILGSSVVMGVGQKSGRDFWISVIIAYLMAVPMVIVYSRILSLYPGKDIFEVAPSILGSVLGKIINISYIWYTFHFAELVTREFAEFLNVVGLPNTPFIVSLPIIAVLAIWMVKSGIEVLGRWIEIFFILIIGINAFILVLLLPEVDINNILPIMEDGIIPVVKSSFPIFAFPFTEIAVFLGVLSSLDSSSSYFNVYFKGLSLGAIILLVITLINFLVVGENFYNEIYFPLYFAARRVNIGTFIQRLEILVSIIYMITCLVQISVCLLVACKGVSKFFGHKDYRFIVFPVALLMINVSYLDFDSIMEYFEWTDNVYHYYALPFQLIIPLILWITAEYKNKKNKSLG